VAVTATPEDLANYHHLDVPLTWAIILEGETDVELL